MPRWLVPLLALLAIFLGAALLAPVLWWAAHGLATAYPDSFLGSLTRHPFHRYVHRCLLILALALAFPLARALGCRSWRDTGLPWYSGAGRALATGAGIGLGMFAALLGIEMILGWREGRGGVGGAVVATVFGRALLAGAAVALAEEFLFRGILCAGLRHSLGWGKAILLSSAVYAALHFLQRVESPAIITWTSGFVVVGRMGQGLVSVERMVPAFGTLCLAGVLLGRSRQRSGGLWEAMGLHASWVVALKLRGALTTSVGGGESVKAFRAEGILVPGWSPFVMMAIAVGMAIGWDWRERRRSATAGGSGANKSE